MISFRDNYVHIMDREDKRVRYGAGLRLHLVILSKAMDKWYKAKYL